MEKEIKEIVRKIYETGDKDQIVSFWDAIASELDQINEVIETELKEHDNQVIDMEHKMAGIDVGGGVMDPPDQEELVTLAVDFQTTLCTRRRLKDLVNIVIATRENCLRNRNFILNMTKRKYTPRSNRFGNTQSEPTTKVSTTQANTENVEQPITKVVVSGALARNQAKFGSRS